MSFTSKTYGCPSNPVINNAIDAFCLISIPQIWTTQTFAYILTNSSEIQNLRRFFPINTFTGKILCLHVWPTIKGKFAKNARSQAGLHQGCHQFIPLMRIL